VTLRRFAQRDGVAAPSRRLPSCCHNAFASEGVGKRVLDSDSVCGTPHGRALIPGSRRRLSGPAQVGWRRSPRLAAKGAPGSGEKPTVSFAQTGCAPHLSWAVLRSCPVPLDAATAPRTPSCGSWEGGGGPGSRSLVPAKTADPFRQQDAYASYKHRPGRLGSIRSSNSPSKGPFWQKRAAEGGMRGQRRISTGGAVDGLRGALDVSQLVANDVAHKRMKRRSTTLPTTHCDDATRV